MSKRSGWITTIAIILVLFAAVLYVDGNKAQIANTQQQVAIAEQALANAEEANDAAAIGDASDALTVTQRVSNANSLGIWTVLPPLIAIVLAFVTKNVVVSLFVGILSGAFLLQIINQQSIAEVFGALLQTFLTACNAMIGVLGDAWNAGVLLQVLVIGGLIALVTKMGGAMAIAEALARKAKTARSAQLVAWLMGVIVFFDDYANSLIVGPVMRPVTDRMRISREKLSFIVDATAAPVAGIALISTWIATELSAIKQGFDSIGQTSGVDYYGLFVSSIPYRFYNLFILGFIVIAALMMRDFGPMLKAETRARKTGKVIADGATPMISEEISKLDPKDGVKLNIWNAIIPIGVLIIGCFVGFYYNGYVAAVSGGVDMSVMPFLSLSGESVVGTAFSNADASVVLFQAAVLSSIVALLMGMGQKIFTLFEGIEVFITGLRSLLITGVILLLAWSLTDMIKALGTNYFLVNSLASSLPYWALPSLVFILGCIISFATGTSYGTMLILTPLTIPMASGVLAHSAVPMAGETYMIMCIGGVLAGAIFGDHCSPISDTTILSSMGAGSDHMDHTRTQLVYALVVAAISIVFGYLLAGLGVPVWVTLIVGLAAIAAVLYFFGKNPDKQTYKE